MDLLEAWKNWEPSDSPPYVLDMDPDALNSRRLKQKAVTFTPEQAAEVANIYGGDFDDGRLHLGLYPLPFAGPLRSASIYVLLANPSVSLGNYRELAAHRRERQLRQELTGDHLSFMEKGLERYVRHDLGLGETARAIADHSNNFGSDILTKLAVIELSPYWSRGFIDGAHRLPSADLAVKFVEETVVPRVRDGEAVLIVTRRVKDWDRNQGLPRDLVDAGHIVLYEGSGEARAASLRPRSRGGKAILRHFGVKTDP